MLTRTGSAALAACVLVACAPAASPRASTSVTGADQGPRAAQEAQPQPGTAEASLVEPVRSRVEHCRSTAGGKLVVRVQKAQSGKLAFDVAPGSSLDPMEKKCVLEALSTLDVDESSTAWAGLNVKPTGFTSLLTIEW